ncbi:MAG: hypothetical protein JXN61_05900 [Sedimentisphaerales bacterium]|nr:hypothetical protein [Sedimentisphaerales bacterium]
MRSSNLWGRIVVFLVICSYTLAWADVKYGGGTGEPNDPYQIWDANHMQDIGADPCDWDKHFVLMANIDLGKFDGRDGREKFNIIGIYVDYSDPNTKPFTGVFDGNNHTISNLTRDSNDAPFYVGLFGYINDSNAKIKNLGLVDPNVDGEGSTLVGSLVGGVPNGTITNCYAEGGSVRGLRAVGGLVGANGGLITDCYATCNVSADEFVGGLLGSNVDTIVNCYATGTVSGGDSVGGLVGHSSYYTTISTCYATGSVLGDYSVGGLVGWISDGYIVNCYSTGNVVGNDNVGGLVGREYCNVECEAITASYWDIETSGEPNMCGSQEGGAGGCDPNCGKTTAQMHQQATFEGWDFINVWNIGQNQTYPYLRTVPAGDINKDETVNFLDLCIIAQQWCNEQ